MKQKDSRPWLERTFGIEKSGRIGCFFATGVFSLASILLMGTCVHKMGLERVARQKEEKAQAATLAEQDAVRQAERKRKGFHCLSGLDGSQPELVDQTKLALRDPDSFQHIETVVWPNVNGKHRIVMAFRSRNGFGGMMPGKAIGTMFNAGCSVLVESIE